MRGLQLARDLALLGAESVANTPVEQIAFAESDWEINVERWRELGERMAEHEASADLLLEQLCGKLGLTSAGYWLVMMCGAAELYPEASAALSIVAENDRVHMVTPLAFMRLMRFAQGLPPAHALDESLEGGLARRLELIEVSQADAGRPFTHQGLRLAATDVACLVRGGPLLRPLDKIWLERQQPAELTAFNESLVRGVTRLLTQRGALCIRCRSPRAGRQLALDVASMQGSEAYYLTVREEPPSPAALARLRDVLPVIDLTAYGHGPGRPFPLPYLVRLKETVPIFLTLVAPNARLGALPAVSIGSIGFLQSQRIWSMVTGKAAVAKRLAMRFRVSLEEARAAEQAAKDARAVENGSQDLDASLLGRQVRIQGAQRMGKMVTHLESPARLDQLAAAPGLKQQLRDIVDWHRSTYRVYGEMGLNAHSTLGRGLSCLFTGPPGTGKTFAAQCLSNELDLNLYRIDLSQVVSKYIGETEKSLATVFEEAEAGHGILLFDEADALFGKRSEVKDAHDRYANIEISYLLQRMETFNGVTILASNLRSNMDAAFTRRIRFVLEFSMPDVTMRQQLWEQALPEKSYRSADLSLLEFVERFSLSGGSIQNIGLAAAHLAAATPEGEVTNRHLAQATFRELEKSGLSRTPSHFGPLARFLEGEAA